MVASLVRAAEGVDFGALLCAVTESVVCDRTKEAAWGLRADGVTSAGKVRVRPKHLRVWLQEALTRGMITAEVNAWGETVAYLPPAQGSAR